jgi:uncharacterized coiled-coil protein SlyX
VSPEERNEVVTLREHLEQRLDDLHEDIAEQKAAISRVEERVAGLVSWRALAAILTTISALAALVFSISDRF